MAYLITEDRGFGSESVPVAVALSRRSAIEWCKGQAVYKRKHGYLSLPKGPHYEVWPFYLQRIELAKK